MAPVAVDRWVAPLLYCPRGWCGKLAEKAGRAVAAATRLGRAFAAGSWHEACARAGCACRLVALCCGPSAPADSVILEQYGNDYLQETQPITALRAICSSGAVLAVRGLCLCACDVSGLVCREGLDTPCATALAVNRCSACGGEVFRPDWHVLCISAGTGDLHPLAQLKS